MVIADILKEVLSALTIAFFGLVFVGPLIVLFTVRDHLGHAAFGLVTHPHDTPAEQGHVIPDVQHRVMDALCVEADHKAAFNDF